MVECIRLINLKSEWVKTPIMTLKVFVTSREPLHAHELYLTNKG